jgi:chromate reductase
MNRPEVMISQAQNKFDAEGKLIDQPTRDFMATFMNAFRDWTLRMR